MPIDPTEKSLLLIGASRGLGYAMADTYLQRGWHVVATERPGARSPVLDRAARSDGRLTIESVDINEPEQVAVLKQRLTGKIFDLLFVNAGVKNDDRETIGDVVTAEFSRVLITNALSPMRVIESYRELVSSMGTIGLMSSGLGSVANNEAGGYEVYRASKAALNTLMRSFRARYAEDRRTMLVMAPGWVRTDMGGPQARLSVEKSIPNLVTTIEAQTGRGGLQYLDYLGRTVAW